jgi:predicted alpha-1,2-mannosidase
MRNLLFIFLFLTACQMNHNSSEKKPVDYVNPLIGTANEGNTMPGAVVPWGLIYAAPHTSTSYKWSGSRYFYADGYMYGFGQLHMSGVGCADFANLTIVPTSGEIFSEFDKNKSRYSNEKAEAGYYSVLLASHHISAEYTATERCSLGQFNFNDTGSANIIIDGSAALSPCRNASLAILSPTRMEGCIEAGGFCNKKNKYKLFFAVQLDKPADITGSWKGKELFPGKSVQNGDTIGAWFSFSSGNRKVMVKTALSFVSTQNAWINMQAEIPSWNFDSIRNTCKNKWNDELSRIAVRGSDEDKKTIFYTALYHSLLHPSIINDVNGEYPAYITKQIKKTVHRNQYHIFSLWDTYRTVHPLLTLVYPEKQTEILRTMVDMVETGGHLPFWELGADDSYVMHGDPCANVIGDSYAKGLRDFDIKSVYKAMKEIALDKNNNPIRDLNSYYSRYGYVPVDDCGPDDEWGKPRMVSACLEYAFADWNISNIARDLNDSSTANYLLLRSEAYKKYYDPSTGFLRPRMKDGSWHTPFSPASYNCSLCSAFGFEEGNSWQYTFFVPHQIQGLINIMGGEKNFNDKLQACFSGKHFTIMNEPDFAFPYLFTYLKDGLNETQRTVASIRDDEFLNSPAGLPGNDDAGATSSWYLFSAMGFYPACPGSTEYRLGIPAFPEITIKLKDNKEFKIIYKRKDQSKNISSKIYLNDKQYDKNYILHSDIIGGGCLVFEE